MLPRLFQNGPQEAHIDSFVSGSLSMSTQAEAREITNHAQPNTHTHTHAHSFGNKHRVESAAAVTCRDPVPESRSLQSETPALAQRRDCGRDYQEHCWRQACSILGKGKAHS